MKAPPHPVKRCATNPHLPPGNCGCYACGTALVAVFAPDKLTARQVVMTNTTVAAKP